MEKMECTDEHHIKHIQHEFDKEKVLNYLKHLIENDNQFIIQNSTTLAYLIRRFNFNFTDFYCKFVDEIIFFLESKLKEKTFESVDENRLIFLCLILKYLTENSSVEEIPLKIDLIIKLLESNNEMDSKIRETLNSLLLLICQKQISMEKYELDLKVLEKILKLPSLDYETISFFNEIYDEQKNADSKFSKKFKFSRNKSNMKKSQIFVTKSTQRTTLKMKKNESEQTDFEFLNLTDNMRKVRSKNINSKSKN